MRRRPPISTRTDTLLPYTTLFRSPDAFLSVAVFAIGVASTALGLMPPEIAFGGVVLVMALTGSLRLRSGLQDVNWTIVILLACMIPLGMAVEQTGAARVIADAVVGHLPTTRPEERRVGKACVSTGRSR